MNRQQLIIQRKLRKEKREEEEDRWDSDECPRHQRKAKVPIAPRASLAEDSDDDARPFLIELKWSTKPKGRCENNCG